MPAVGLRPAARRGAPAAGGGHEARGAAIRPSVAAAVEFVLEGLHLSRKLNKDMQAGPAAATAGQ